MPLYKYLLSSLLFLTSSVVFAAGYSLPNNQWRIISLPANPGASNTVEAIFGNEPLKPQQYKTHWIIYTYHPESKGYDAPLELNSTLKQGIGYWIIQDTGKTATLNMPEGSTIVTDSFSTPLASSAGDNNGWNLIGNPFSNTEAIGTFRIKTEAGPCGGQGCNLDEAQNDNLVHNLIWTYNGRYITKGIADTLPPWEGFWMATRNGSQGHTLSLNHRTFSLKSDNFKEGETIPQRSPALHWHNPPKETKSFAVIIDDPDAKPHNQNRTYVHWGVFNISKNTSSLPPLPANSVEGKNSQNTNEFASYGPPSNDPVHEFHTYRFAVYALNVPELSIDTNTPWDRKHFEEQFADKIISKAALSGIRYSRRN
jgi:Raf kinase inhibitor-like YbhB/YbcL family protein